MVGGIDSSASSREKFQGKFNKPAFKKISEVPTENGVDLVVLAIPPEKHLGEIKSLLTLLSPKLILIEKPFSRTFKEAREVMRISEEKGAEIAVNYIREYEPEHRRLVERINDGELGSPLTAVCWYTKGLINNGSHFIQFLNNFMGTVIDINIIHTGLRWEGKDPEPTLELVYENGRAYFLPGQEENFRLFEMELIGTEGKVKYYQGGEYLDWWKIRKKSTMSGHKTLRLKPERTHTSMKFYQYHVYENIAQFLAGNNDLYCDARMALRTMEIIGQIEDQLG